MPRRSLGVDGTGRPSIPEKLAIKSRGHGVLDAPLEPVIGLAEGKTRWRARRELEISSGRRLASKPGKAGLHRVVGAVEFAQIGQPAYRQAMHVLFAGLEQRGDVSRHLDA